MTFRHEIRIRYGEVDMQGVVFNAHYLAFVDDCVDSWLRSIDAHFERFGWDLMVKKATIEWAGGAGLGDVLTLVPHVSRWGTTSFDVTIEGSVGERPVFEAMVVYVGVTTGTRRDRADPRRDQSCTVRVTTASLGRDFYRRDPRLVAADLLNKVLVRGDRSARIVEVEAYCGSIDPGSHAFRGRTNRNAAMFGPPGGLYVYFTYGMHWCANAVCGDEDEGVAVLLRAGTPLSGLDEMYAARGRAARRDRDLCSGPAKLCEAFGLDKAFDGADLVTCDRGVTIVDDGTRPPPIPGNSVRIGLTAGAEHPWRWFVTDEPNVSRRR